MHQVQTRRADPVVPHRFNQGVAAMMALIFICLCASKAAVSTVSAGQVTDASAAHTDVPDEKNNKGKKAGKPDPVATWGIRVLGVRRTSADYILEFRYRVLDAEKAAYLMNRKIKPELIVQKSGRKLQVPVSSKIGPLRQSPKFTKINRNYFMFFANPGRTVKAGDKVTVVIGDFSVKDLVVE